MGKTGQFRRKTGLKAVFKGRKQERERRGKEQTIAQNMEDMPIKVAEWRQVSYRQAGETFALSLEAQMTNLLRHHLSHRTRPRLGQKPDLHSPSKFSAQHNESFSPSHHISCVMYCIEPFAMQRAKRGPSRGDQATLYKGRISSIIYRVK